VLLEDDSRLSVLHSKYAVVMVPLGFTLALRVAEFNVIDDAEVVLAVGTTASVVKPTIEDLCVPAPFCATSR
jgi:hypothetical protein